MANFMLCVIYYSTNIGGVGEGSCELKREGSYGLGEKISEHISFLTQASMRSRSYKNLVYSVKDAKKPQGWQECSSVEIYMKAFVYEHAL